MPEISPSQVTGQLTRALRELDMAASQRRAEEEALAAYLAQRAEETAAERRVREQQIEALKQRERAARATATQAKQRLDQLVAGVEDGSIQVPEPPPESAEAAAAEITALREQVAALQAERAQLEQRTLGVAAELDDEAARLGEAAR